MESYKILIVEDELIVAKSIARNLEKFNYQVVGMAISGEEAIDFVAKNRPDLILMDIFLQGEINGIKAANTIWSLYKVPVIYLTANADISTVNQAKLTGSFGYILKPFKVQELQANIEIAMGKYREQIREQDALAAAERLRKNAEKLNQMKSEYIAIASHEFRTPLTCILGSSSLLENYGDNLSESQKHKHFQRIQKAVKEMNYLLEDILLLENAESQKITCDRKPIELVKFCHQILEELEVMYPGRTVDLQPDYPLMNAQLDPVILRHILLNLLSNALKYSQPNSPVYLQINLTNEAAIFKIQDQGIGIPSEDLENLFVSFHRGKNVGKIPGTGLGLSIVNNFIQIHRGEISFDSVVNSGTTVTVTLPLK